MIDVDIYKGEARRHHLAATSTRSFEIGPSQQREGACQFHTRRPPWSRRYRVPRHHRKLLEKKSTKVEHKHSSFHRSPRQPVQIFKVVCGVVLEGVERRYTIK